MGPGLLPALRSTRPYGAILALLGLPAEEAAPGEAVEELVAAVPAVGVLASVIAAGGGLGLARKYSFSDRARYYIGQPEVTAAIDKLFANLKEYPIPMNMLHQYMPVTYAKVRDGVLPLDPKELALDGVTFFMLDYEYAVAQ